MSGWSERAARSRPPASSGRSRCGPGWPGRPAASPSCPSCAARPCPAFGDLVFGGHDVATTPLVKKAEALAAAGVMPVPAGRRARRRAGRGREELRPRRPARTQARPPTRRRRPDRLPRAARAGPGGGGQRLRHRAGAAPHPAHADLGRAARRAGTAPDAVLPPSSLYAYAAFSAGCPYVDFTPSTGAAAARAGRAGRGGRAAVRRARRQDRGDAGQVGAGADVRACATCAVRSWSGVNLLGGGDGANLADPAANAAKVRQQAARARRDAGLRPAGPHPHRVRRGHRRLQDRLGSDHLQRVPRHRRCGWSSPGTAATRRWPRRWCSTWPGSPPPRTPPGGSGPLAELALLLQGPARRRPPTRWPSSGRGCAAFTDGLDGGTCHDRWLTSPSWSGRRPRSRCPVTWSPARPRPAR